MDHEEHSLMQQLVRSVSENRFSADILSLSSFRRIVNKNEDEDIG